MTTLYYRNAVSEDGIQGVTHHVNRIIGCADSNPEPIFHPNLLVRLPIFAIDADDFGGRYFRLCEAGVYEVVEEYWTGHPSQVYCRTYTYYCCNYEGVLDLIIPDAVFETMAYTPYFKAVEFTCGNWGLCSYEV